MEGFLIYFSSKAFSGGGDLVFEYVGVMHKKHVVYMFFIMSEVGGGPAFVTEGFQSSCGGVGGEVVFFVEVFPESFLVAFGMVIPALG